MIKLNKKELKIKQVIVQFLKDNNVYPQFIKEFNKGYRKFLIEYYLHVENFDINNTSFNTFVKRINEDIQNSVIVATYSRCSTSDQKSHGDIDRQSERLVEYSVKHKYKIEHIIKDMGSGLNDKRKGFVKLCKLVIDKKINKIIIEHKDRLTRFQYNLIEMFFQ